MTDGIEAMSAAEAEAAEAEAYRVRVGALVQAMVNLTTKRGFPPAASVDGMAIASWLLLRASGLAHGEIAQLLRDLVDRLEDDPPEVLGAVPAGKRRADA